MSFILNTLGNIFSILLLISIPFLSFVSPVLIIIYRLGKKDNLDLILLKGLQITTFICIILTTFFHIREIFDKSQSILISDIMSIVVILFSFQIYLLTLKKWKDLVFLIFIPFLFLFENLVRTLFYTNLLTPDNIPLNILFLGVYIVIFSLISIVLPIQLYRKLRKNTI